MELDEYLGFQFDAALALKYYFQEEKNKYDMLDVVSNGIMSVCKGLGMKVTKKMKASSSRAADSNEPKPLAEVLAELGGHGVVIERKKK